MAQKEHLLTKLVFVCFIIFGCSNHKDKKIVANFEKVDLSKIPNRIIFKDDSELKLLNGVYHLNDKLHSGFIKEMYATDSIKSIGSYLFGKQHGVTKTFFTDGSLESDFQGNLYSVPYKIKSIGIITESGVILKSYNVQSVELIGTDTYRITFVNPMPDNNYVVLLSSTRNVSYKNRTANYFDVEVDYFIGQFDFNFIIINL